MTEQDDLKIRLESLREAETTRLQRLLALKRMGASLEYDDGRKLDDLLEEASDGRAQPLRQGHDSH